ncbi:hypothetical protein ACM26V_19930 [Salipaludibacillus sp. HK11]|uniref:hypothetical protein n=1 Tax=Salipaludibacillus sp. HK11 TaxID=3394320 RepID=UPI0039FC6D5E
MMNKKSIAVASVMTSIVAGFIFVYFITLNDEMKQQAKKEAITLISDLKEVDETELTVDSSDFARDYGSYAIAVIDKEKAEKYQVAVILNEEHSGIDFAIDVTDTYDKYGLAYCH